MSHPQVVKEQAYIARELPHFLGDAAHTFELDDADGESPQSGNVFRAMASAYAAAVFIIVPIDNVMAAVFDTPVAAVGGKNAFCVDLLRGPAGDAIGDFTGGFAGFFVCGLALDEKSLSNMGKVQIAVEFSFGPDFADFDPTVIGRVVLNEMEIFPVFKIKEINADWNSFYKKTDSEIKLRHYPPKKLQA